MENGQYTFFVIQHREIARSEWAKPEDGIQPIPILSSADWNCCGDDYWGRSTNPHIGTGNRWRPANQRANDEWFQCRSDTGMHGWFTFKYAVAALNRCREHDAKGWYNTFGTYGTLEQVVRHEFRIAKVKMTFEQSIEPLTIEDTIAAFSGKT